MSSASNPKKHKWALGVVAATAVIALGVLAVSNGVFKGFAPAPAPTEQAMAQTEPTLQPSPSDTPQMTANTPLPTEKLQANNTPTAQGTGAGQTNQGSVGGKTLESARIPAEWTLVGDSPVWEQNKTIKPEIKVMAGGRQLIDGEDYRLIPYGNESEKNWQTVGEKKGKIALTDAGREKYELSGNTIEFTIMPKLLGSPKITENRTFYFTGILGCLTVDELENIINDPQVNTKESELYSEENQISHKGVSHVLHYLVKTGQAWSELKFLPVNADTLELSVENADPEDWFYEIELRDAPGDITKEMAGAKTVSAGVKITFKASNNCVFPDNKKEWLFNPNFSFKQVEAFLQGNDQMEWNGAPVSPPEVTLTAGGESLERELYDVKWTEYLMQDELDSFSDAGTYQARVTLKENDDLLIPNLTYDITPKLLKVGSMQQVTATVKYQPGERVSADQLLEVTIDGAPGQDYDADYHAVTMPEDGRLILTIQHHDPKEIRILDSNSGAEVVSFRARDNRAFEVDPQRSEHTASYEYSVKIKAEAHITPERRAFNAPVVHKIVMTAGGNELQVDRDYTVTLISAPKRERVSSPDKIEVLQRQVIKPTETDPGNSNQHMIPGEYVYAVELTAAGRELYWLETEPVQLTFVVGSPVEDTPTPEVTEQPGDSGTNNVGDQPVTVEDTPAPTPDATNAVENPRETDPPASDLDGKGGQSATLIEIPASAPETSNITIQEDEASRRIREWLNETNFLDKMQADWFQKIAPIFPDQDENDVLTKIGGLKEGENFDDLDGERKNEILLAVFSAAERKAVMELLLGGIVGEKVFDESKKLNENNSISEWNDALWRGVLVRLNQGQGGKSNAVMALNYQVKGIDNQLKNPKTKDIQQLFEKYKELGLIPDDAQHLHEISPEVMWERIRTLSAWLYKWIEENGGKFDKTNAYLLFRPNGALDGALKNKNVKPHLPEGLGQSLKESDVTSEWLDLWLLRVRGVQDENESPSSGDQAGTAD